MSLRVADRVEDWQQQPFDGGYAGLADLADREFSGVVRAGGAELYMTSGTVVGANRGSIQDLEAATGTTYEAPVPALPLLCVMQDAEDEVRAQYYTEETPISEVDATLSDGGFTGFVELAENVLSGDYFLVYHGGRSMAVGFVGAAGQLISGDEAYETADDEVGIYKVRQVDVQPIDIPEPAETGAAAAPASTADGSADEDADEDEAEEATSQTPDPSAQPDVDEAVEDEPASEPDTTETSEEPATSTADTDPDGSAADQSSNAASDEASDAGQASRSDVEQTRGDSAPGRTESTMESHTSQVGGQRESGPVGGPNGRTGGPEPNRSTDDRGAVDLETRSVPSLDPDRTRLPEGERQSPSPPAPSAEPEPGRSSSQQSGEPEPEPAARSDPSGAIANAGEAADLEARLEEREAEIERLESALDAAESERDDLAAELEALRDQRDSLEADVERLESELARMEEDLGVATDAQRRLNPSEALEGTNLFVDYDSKGAATLSKAQAGSAGREEVAENLQLGIHTEFEDDGVAVNGQAFDTWLRSTLQYRFAEWLVGTLLFEIRDTGHADDLVDLYEAIPEIRRVEFNGAVDVEYVEDGQEIAGPERFDVIFRHRMGDPLVVANLNDSRDPATGGMMETLVTAAERVGQSAGSLSTAVLVTSSFFESEALETVGEATRGGILSRDKRTSFVNLSRKQGYHLCLVAAREGNFHMEVPEL